MADAGPSSTMMQSIIDKSNGVRKKKPAIGMPMPMMQAPVTGVGRVWNPASGQPAPMPNPTTTTGTGTGAPPTITDSTNWGAGMKPGGMGGAAPTPEMLAAMLKMISFGSQEGAQMNQKVNPSFPMMPQGKR